MVEPREKRWQLRRYYERQPDSEPEPETERPAGGAGEEAPPERAAGDEGAGEPATEAERGPLMADPIEQRRGSYLLSFGLPGSGKTTFQSFLAYYVTHIGPFEAEPVVAPETSAQGWEPLVTFNEWMRMWGQGGFPPANPVTEGDIREMTFRVRPLRGGQGPVELSFLEVSGELMTQVVADRVSDPAMIETLGRYLANEEIRLLLFLIVDPHRLAENDILFQNLMSYLELHYPGVRERMSLAVLVSKPEEALRQLRERDARYQEETVLRAELCEAYVQRFAPRTYRILDGWPRQDRVQLMALHLGEVVEDEQGARLREADYQDIDAIFAWIYRQLTGGRLGPPWWQRLLDWLRP